MNFSSSQIVSKVARKMQHYLDTGREFNIPLAEIKALFDEGRCAYTGVKFQSDQQCTFERINPKLGYVSGNVVLVTKEANAVKSSLDAFVKNTGIVSDEMKLKLLRKAVYAIEKELKHGRV